MEVGKRAKGKCLTEVMHAVSARCRVARLRNATLCGAMLRCPVLVYQISSCEAGGCTPPWQRLTAGACQVIPSGEAQVIDGIRGPQIDVHPRVLLGLSACAGAGCPGTCRQAGTPRREQGRRGEGRAGLARHMGVWGRQGLRDG